MRERARARASTGVQATYLIVLSAHPVMCPDAEPTSGSSELRGSGDQYSEVFCAHLHRFHRAKTGGRYRRCTLYHLTARPRRTSLPLGLPSQQNRSDNAFRFKRAAFYMGLKSKVGLVAAKASALRINLNIQGCSIVAPPLHAPSRAPLLLPLLLNFTQYPSPPRSLVRDGQTSSHRPRLVVSRSTCPPLPPSRKSL